MKKVLVITNMYPSKVSRTFGIFVRNQVEGLKAQGLDVDVVSIKDPRMGKPYVIKKYLTWLIQLTFTFLVKRKRYDIVHAHYVFPSGWFGRLFKKFSKAKLFVTAHGGDIDRMARKNQKIGSFTRDILRDADHIIAAGEKLKQDMVNDFQANPEKISVMSMGVNRELFKPMPKTEAKGKVGLSGENFDILFVGNIIKAKGLDELLTAFHQIYSKHPEARLHIFGEVKEPAFHEHLLSRMQTEGMGGIHFHSSVPQKELAVWMAAADLFVLPSHMEGLGLVAVEAMACHTPVIATKVGGLAYLLEDGHGYLVEPKSPKELEEGIQTLIEQPELRNGFVEKGEKLADKHSEKNIIRQVIQLYEKIGEK